MKGLNFHHIFSSWETRQCCQSKYVFTSKCLRLLTYCGYVTPSDFFFSKYQTLSRRWHFRQQVSHAWKMLQSTDGALKWLHRNRTHVTDRFNFPEVTFMMNVDRTEKREKFFFFIVNVTFGKFLKLNSELGHKYFQTISYVIIPERLKIILWKLHWGQPLTYPVTLYWRLTQKRHHCLSVWDRCCFSRWNSILENRCGIFI